MHQFGKKVRKTKGIVKMTHLVEWEKPELVRKKGK